MIVTWKGKKPWENPSPWHLWGLDMRHPRVRDGTIACERCGRDYHCLTCGVLKTHYTCLCYKPDLFREYSRRQRADCWRPHSGLSRIPLPAAPGRRTSGP